MGQFTKRVSRRAKGLLHTFTIPASLLPIGWRGPDRLRKFSLRQLSGDEVTWNDTMIRRSVALIAGKRAHGAAVRVWWQKIGPKGRAGVRLCFQTVHRADGWTASRAPSPVRLYTQDP